MSRGRGGQDRRRVVSEPAAVAQQRQAELTERFLARARGASQYDPFPDLAALIDELREWARGGGRQATMERIMTGPYARLRGGLLLDEPGREGVSTEDAITEAIEAYIGHRL